MTMRGLWLENKKFSYREDLETPIANESEALIQVHLAGICSTDLEMGKGYYPFYGVPGHEFVGNVIQAYSEPSWVGKRVVGEINITCGRCVSCLAGRNHHCLERKTLGIHDKNGVFAEFVTLPIGNLHLVADNIPDEIAVFAEPVAAALEIQQQIHIQPDQRILIVGAGRLGMLVALTMQLTGCDLSVVVRHETQRRILSAHRIKTVDEAEVPSGKMDVVVDVTGSAEGFGLARRSVRPGGTIVMKSTYKGDMTINFSSLVVDEITLIGSRCGPFPPALRYFEYGYVDPRPLIVETYPLSKGLEALEFAAQRGILKVLLKP